MKVDAGGGANLEVEPDQLLKVAATIRRIAQERRRSIEAIFNDLPDLRPGKDQISTDAADGWLERLRDGEGSHLQRITEYFNRLNDLAEQLTRAAKEYGYTDEDARRALAEVMKQR